MIDALHLAAFLLLRTWYALTVGLGTWLVQRRWMWLCRWQCRFMLMRPTIRGLYALGWRPKNPGGVGAGAPHIDTQASSSA